MVKHVQWNTDGFVEDVSMIVEKHGGISVLFESKSVVHV